MPRIPANGCLFGYDLQLVGRSVQRTLNPDCPDANETSRSTVMDRVMATALMILKINSALPHVDLREPAWIEKCAGMFGASALLG